MQGWGRSRWGILSVDMQPYDCFIGFSMRATACGLDKSLDPIRTILKQEVHFQNIEHMTNGCKQIGFHSFNFTKGSNTVDLLQMFFFLIVAMTTLEIFFPTRGLLVGMYIQDHTPIRFLNYSI